MRHYKKTTLGLTALCAAFSLCFPVAANAGGLVTIAGNAKIEPAVATDVILRRPTAVATDSKGNLYIADTQRHMIRKIDGATGKSEVIAGTGALGFAGDNGPARLARFNSPEGIAVDAAGNVYVSDSLNQRIRRIDAATGIITTIAGTEFADYRGDNGPAKQAGFNYPTGLAFDRTGNLYVADSYNHRVRKIDMKSGIVTAFAGIQGDGGFSGDGGPAIGAQLANPTAIAFDQTGNMFIADAANNRIRRVDAVSGLLTTYAGTGATGMGGDGIAATAANFDWPQGVAVDASGNVYISDSSNNRLRKIDSRSKVISTLAGYGNTTYGGYDKDGVTANQTRLNNPAQIAIDPAGNLFVADSENHRIRKIDTKGLISTFAGVGDILGDGGPALSAPFVAPRAMAFDAVGNLYVADTDNNRVRMIDTKGRLATIAGGKRRGADGRIPDAEYAKAPAGVAVDASGNVYIADTGYHRILRRDGKTGVLSVIAGVETAGYGGDDGPAIDAAFNKPAGLAVDKGGNLYIADSLNGLIRRIHAKTGVITTIAGGGEELADGVLATQADIGAPAHIAMSQDGHLLIADWTHHLVRKVNLFDGTITTIAGNGKTSKGAGLYAGDGGPAVVASLNFPASLSVAPNGDIYIADTLNHAIRRVDAKTGTIDTVAGSGAAGFNGDGMPGKAALLSQPRAVAVDAKGNLFFADSGNNRIRGLPADNQKSDADRVLDWAVQTYPTILQPADAPSLTAGGYYYRYFEGTNRYVGVRDDRVYYLDANGGALNDLGSLADYLKRATSIGN
ncbi:NHL domain-containing protein [Parachitinimonas caeni]|uniref:Teneurin NHL domain-containing protein n=1 Tax=Parachitinimonas caeni TaxID=3031301 RepID=A0ABT7DTE9_9NEIS|nr:hypothetical protein [Parachitinimonas caeni]MDK2123351.1 hypothetical protein [Parachitinimonas caeni]